MNDFFLAVWGLIIAIASIMIIFLIIGVGIGSAIAAFGLGYDLAGTFFMWLF